MSVTVLWAGCAIATSSFALALLALRDPKRLRAVARLGVEVPAPASRARRRMLASVALFPGLALMLIGHWPAFLIWLGTTAMVGWVLALTVNSN